MLMMCSLASLLTGHLYSCSAILRRGQGVYTTHESKFLISFRFLFVTYTNFLSDLGSSGLVLIILGLTKGSQSKLKADAHCVSTDSKYFFLYLALKSYYMFLFPNVLSNLAE